jgi:hypothetical protein
MQLNFNDLLRITLRLFIVPINQVQILNFRHFQVWFITCAQALSYFVLILDYILRCAMACEHDSPPLADRAAVELAKAGFPAAPFGSRGVPPGGAKGMFAEASLPFCRQLPHHGERATGRGHLQTKPLDILVPADPIGSLRPRIACCSPDPPSLPRRRCDNCMIALDE